MLGKDGTVTATRFSRCVAFGVLVSSRNQNREWIYDSSNHLSEGVFGQTFNTHVRTRAGKKHRAAPIVTYRKTR